MPIPPSSTPHAQAQASIRRSAPVLAGGVAGASLVALLAVSSVVAPVLAGGASLATLLAWLGGLGGNALAGWLTEWAASRLAHFDGDDPDGERHLLEQLARDLTPLLAQRADLAEAAELLIVQTDAVAVALGALTGQADKQARLLRTLLEDLQQATFHNARLHEATLQTVATSTRQLLAAQGQGHALLKGQLDTLLATVVRLEATVRQSPPSGGVAVAGDAGVVQVPHLTNSTVRGDIVGQQNIYVLPPRGGEPVRLADALARLQALPRTDIPALAPLPPGSRMPLRRNPLFVGREADLHALACAMANGATVAIGQIAAATGLGGIGKTNLASEFVHRYGQFFAGGVFWLSFGDPAAIPAEVAACGAAGLVERPDWAALRPDDQVRLVCAAWAEPIPRLLVFDNCDDTDTVSAEALLSDWCPSSGGARVLITSRRGAWDTGLGVTPCALGVLARAESIDLLRRLHPALPEADADAIAATVGDLPLALHLSGNFLHAYPSVVPAAYLRELETALLAHPALEGRGTSYSPTQHERHVARTFALSYDRLTRDDPTDTAAQALLARAACFAPGEPIPRAILLATLTQRGEDELLAEDGLRRLVALGLLAEEPGGALTLHRLLVAFVGRLGADLAAQTAVEAVLTDMLHQASTDNTSYYFSLRPLDTHLRAIGTHTMRRNEPASARLCWRIGEYLHWTNDDDEALHYLQTALKFYRRVGNLIGEANVLHVIGVVQVFRNDHDAALVSYTAALTLFRQDDSRLGEAIILQRIGEVQRFHNDHDAALASYTAALTLFRQDDSRLGEANVLYSIGEVQRDRKEMDAALASYTAALTLFRQDDSR
ncbi:MAG: tetratricopeptide repeat protein, partial [Chloroflexales bacterium]